MAAPVRRRKAGTSRVTLTTRGALFTEGEPKRVVEKFVDEVKEEAAQLGHDLLRQRFGKAFKHPTGKYESSVVVERAERGDWKVTDNFVIYGSWLEGTGQRNKTTRFKGYGSFRKTRLELRKKIIPLAQAKLDKALEGLR